MSLGIPEVKLCSSKHSILKRRLLPLAPSVGDVNFDHVVYLPLSSTVSTLFFPFDEEESHGEVLRDYVYILFLIKFLPTTSSING